MPRPLYVGLSNTLLAPVISVSLGLALAALVVTLGDLR